MHIDEVLAEDLKKKIPSRFLLGTLVNEAAISDYFMDGRFTTGLTGSFDSQGMEKKYQVLWDNKVPTYGVVILTSPGENTKFYSIKEA